MDWPDWTLDVLSSPPCWEQVERRAEPGPLKDPQTVIIDVLSSSFPDAFVSHICNKTGSYRVYRCTSHNLGFTDTSSTLSGKSFISVIYDNLERLCFYFPQRFGHHPLGYLVTALWVILSLPQGGDTQAQFYWGNITNSHLYILLFQIHVLVQSLQIATTKKIQTTLCFLY